MNGIQSTAGRAVVTCLYCGCDIMTAIVVHRLSESFFAQVIFGVCTMPMFPFLYEVVF